MTRVGNYWHMLPEASQARKAIWTAVNPHTGRRRIDEAFPLQIRESTRDQDMFIRFKNGSTWQVLGSDNFNSLVGSPPVGVVFSEYALANPAAWSFIRPILDENGGWALFISTPRGRNHLARLYDYAKYSSDWFAQLLTVDDTKAIPLDVIEKARKELTAERGPQEAAAIIQQEYYCSFDAALPGSYYGEILAGMEKKGLLTNVPHDPGFQVGTAWDIGFGDATAIWFYQCIGREIRIIDYYEMSGADLAHYAKILKDKPYNYYDHILPHDAGHGDIRGSTITEMLTKLGVKPNRVLPIDRIDAGIHAVRAFLPRCVFDVRNCERGIDAMRAYRKEWDDNRQAFKDKPLHDWTSHAADAFRYLAQGFRPAYNSQPMQMPRQADSNYDYFRS